MTAITRLVPLLISALLFLGMLAAPATATATASAPSNYIALGDSLPFGYNPNLSPYQPANFVSYADKVAAARGLKLTNPSCPGETTQHYLSLSGQDYLCGLYRLAYPLHVWYLASQADEANLLLGMYGPSTVSLVTIQLGENNYWLLRSNCASNQACIDAGMPGVEAHVTADLNTAVGRLRTAGYHGRIVLLSYYGPQTAGSAEDNDVAKLDQAIGSAATANGLPLADTFSAFQSADAPFNGDPCAAGLLVKNTDGTCDIHASSAGHSLMANLVLSIAGG